MIPVIILTTSTKEIEQCYRLGACVYIAKPTCGDVFSNILRYVLSRDVIKEAQELQVLFPRTP